MEDFDFLKFVAMAVSLIIMLILVLAITSLGNLIEVTPDGKERRGERIRDEKSTQSITSPKNMSKIYAFGLLILCIIGGIIVQMANASKVILIIGGITMFSALLFASTIVLFELMIYNTMQKNLKEFNGSVVV